MNDKRYGWPTTRRYPRTTKEAFPDDIENAQWWYPPEKNNSPMNYIMLAVAIWLWLGLGYYLLYGGK